jgi:hypothetical protein
MTTTRTTPNPKTAKTAKRSAELGDLSGRVPWARPLGTVVSREVNRDWMTR